METLNINKYKSFNFTKITIILVSVLTFYILIVKPYFDTKFLNDKYVSVTTSGYLSIVSKKPKSWLRLKSISKEAITAIVISEDWAFYSHSGVDFRQIYHSIKDAFKGKNLRGASTISQQVVKNIYFSSRRSFVRKFYELFYTSFLEFNLSKSKILELYINLAELGPEVYGLNNASRYYFNKHPSELSARHGAFLATMLPSPVKYNESFRNRELTHFVLGNMNRILDKMVMAKYLSKEEANQQKQNTFQWERRKAEFLDDSDEDFFELN
jgi:monofunctional biosynthetic peptidoglycan transglycosylase